MQDTSFTIDTGRSEDAERIAAFQVAMAKETEDCPLDPATVDAGVKRMLEMPAPSACSLRHVSRACGQGPLLIN